MARALEDLTGWGTLPGRCLFFDTATGERLPTPRWEVGQYDRTPVRGLPTDWIDLFIRVGWLTLADLANGQTAWMPTRVGLEIRDRWLVRSS